MQRNVGGADKVVRILVGLAVIGIGLYYKSWWGVIGIVPLGTALMGWCPPYAMLGINTCSAKPAAAQPAQSPPDGGADVGGDGEG